MKVIFLEDVPKIAKAGEVRDVSDGYGRNFLIPQKLAMAASPGAMKAVKAELDIRMRGEARTEAELLELAKELDGKEVALTARTGGKERLYGSITSADIAAELERITKVSFDKRKIELAEPIRHIGSYEVVVRLGKDIAPKIKVTVTEKAG